MNLLPTQHIIIYDSFRNLEHNEFCTCDELVYVEKLQMSFITVTYNCSCLCERGYRVSGYLPTNQKINEICPQGKILSLLNKKTAVLFTCQKFDGNQSQDL